MKIKNKEILSPLKNPLLRLAYINCIQKRIKLKEYDEIHDTPTITEQKTAYNFYYFLEEARIILNRLEKAKKGNIGKEQTDIKSLFNKYSKKVKQRKI